MSNNYVVAAIPSPTPSLPPVNCTADIVIVVDTSGIIGNVHFIGNLRLYLSQSVTMFDIDSGKMRVGLVTFSTNIGTVINLNVHSSLKSLQSAISSLRYTEGGTTNTAAALHYVRTRMFTSAAGDRDNVHNVVVLVTDRRSNNFNATMVSVEFIVLFIMQYLLFVSMVRYCVKTMVLLHSVILAEHVFLIIYVVSHLRLLSGSECK